MAETYFNTQDGRLYIGAVAIAEGMEQPGNELVPLRDILQDTEFDTAKYTERTPTRGWTQEDFMAYGRWAIALLSEDESKKDPEILKLSYPLLAKMNSLNLGPHPDTIKKNHDSIWSFSEQLGVANVRLGDRYEDWTFSNFVEYASRIAKDVGRKPRETDYEERYRRGEGPHPNFITRRYGQRNIHEAIGYPNIRGWDEQDYIDWGVKVRLANPDRAFTSESVIQILAKAGRGPWDITIRKRFGTISKFQQLVAEELEAHQTLQAEQDAQLMEVHDMLANRGELELPDDVEDGERLKITAKYIVIRKCFAAMARESAASLATQTGRSFTALLQLRDPELTAGFIESTAVALDVFDYIWPMDEWRENLRVDMPPKK